MIDNRVISPGDRKEADILQRWALTGELPMTAEEKAQIMAEMDALFESIK